MSIKQERLASIIKRNLYDILTYDVKDPNVGFVTITDVTLTGDLSIAKVYVTFLDKVDKNDYRLEALARAKGLIRSKLAKTLSVRRCPDLVFVLDNSLANGNHIEEILNEIIK